MKFLLFLALAVGCAAAAPKDPAETVKNAATVKAEGYYKSKAFAVGSSDLRVIGTAATIEQAYPTPGAPGRWTVTGSVVLQIVSSRGGKETQKRSFSASVELTDKGAAHVVDFSPH